MREDDRDILVIILRLYELARPREKPFKIVVAFDPFPLSDSTEGETPSTDRSLLDTSRSSSSLLLSSPSSRMSMLRDVSEE
jgi:hypothetical protein